MLEQWQFAGSVLTNAICGPDVKWWDEMALSLSPEECSEPDDIVETTLTHPPRSATVKYLIQYWNLFIGVYRHYSNTAQYKL